jgi:hypothetical protein
MTRTAHVLTLLSFALMATFVTLGSLFIAGYAFEDPGGWAAVGLVALWLVPLVVLTAVARLWVDAATWLLGIGLALVTVGSIWFALDFDLWRDFMNDVGPVFGIACFVLGLPIAVLGLRRQLSAGLMLVVLALMPYAAFLIGISDEPWRGVGASLTTSSTISTVPTLVVALLYLLAAFLGRLGTPASPVESPPQSEPAAPPVGAGTSQ